MRALHRSAPNPAIAGAIRSSRRVLLGIAPVALALVVLAAAPAKSAADDVAQNIVPIADLVGSLPGLLPPDRPSGAGRNNVPLFFGFLEFDWDPNAPGGVPGFDLWAADGETPR